MPKMPSQSNKPNLSIVINKFHDNSRSIYQSGESELTQKADVRPHTIESGVQKKSSKFLLQSESTLL